MRYWWVNQNQTYRHEVGGGYMWSPKVNKNGVRNRFYDSMTEVEVGDLVFSFCDTLIKAIGFVSAQCESQEKPVEFGNTGQYWNREGWLVSVQFFELDRPIRPKDFISIIAPYLPAKYSPLKADGDGNQGVYLAPVPDDMANVLVALLDGQVETAIKKASVFEEIEDAMAIAEISSVYTLPKTQQIQLIRARLGQGLFRSRVAVVEPFCRVTGIDDLRFLVASHIKPWSKSSDAERLDGSNGLLLAPHVDLLFDRGFITFQGDGSVIRSEHLPVKIGEKFGLDSPAIHRPLTEQQSMFMSYHTLHIFKA